MLIACMCAPQADRRRVEYMSELVYDGDDVRHLPHAVEAFFGNAANERERFAKTHGYSPPLLEFDLTNWDTPFVRCVEGC